MELDSLVTMSVSSWTNYVDDEDIEMAVGKVEFLSTRPNTHNHKYSEDVIKRDAHTVLGKFVVAKYDKWENDAQGHEKDEVIVGYVPNSQEISFYYDSDGYLVASVDVVISKLYATEIYELFKTKNYKSVSIEELVNFTEETRTILDGMAEKVVDCFNITGITILGDKYNPSVPNANIQLTRMSENSIKELEEEYVKYSESHKDNSVDMFDIVLSKLESIEQKLDKGEIMADAKKKEVLADEVVNSEEISNAEEVEVENAETEDMACEPKEEDMACEDSEKVDNAEEEVIENSEEEVVDNACEDKVENAEENAETEEEAEDNVEDCKMQELETKLSEAENKIASYEAELSELRDFKQSVENSEKSNIANQTLAKISDFINAEEYAEYKKQFEECSYSDVNYLRNSILAKYFDQVMSMSKRENEDVEIEDMGIPMESPKKVNSIYN